jgi:hypothetical protein
MLISFDSDGKFRELNSGGTKLIAINSTLDRHAALLQVNSLLLLSCFLYTPLS